MYVAKVGTIESIVPIPKADNLVTAFAILNKYQKKPEYLFTL